MPRGLLQTATPTQRDCIVRTFFVTVDFATPARRLMKFQLKSCLPFLVRIYIEFIKWRGGGEGREEAAWILEESFSVNFKYAEDAYPTKACLVGSKAELPKFFAAAIVFAEEEVSGGVLNTIGILYESFADI